MKGQVGCLKKSAHPSQKMFDKDMCFEKAKEEFLSDEKPMS